MPARDTQRESISGKAQYSGISGKVISSGKKKPPQEFVFKFYFAFAKK
jgi:hypothetical protein